MQRSDKTRKKKAIKRHNRLQKLKLKILCLNMFHKRNHNLQQNLQALLSAFVEFQFCLKTGF